MIHKEFLLNEKGVGIHARLCVYIQDVSQEMPYSQKRKMVLICPGGGYEMTSDREAEVIALRLLGMGHHAAVLRYSTEPARYPTALLEVGKSMEIIRSNAEKWHVEPDKVFVMGFSAGGHLAASLGVLWHRSFLAEELNVSAKLIRPNGMILCYPVITSKEEYWHEGSFQALLGEKLGELREEVSLETQVSEQTPKCFLWHTYEDESVPVENSMLFAQALVKHRIPVEFHLYEKGVHGLGLATEITKDTGGRRVQQETESWIDLLEVWLRNA